MAYIAFDEAASIGLPTVSVRSRPVADVPPPPKPRFSALEWSVVMLAARDKLSTLATPGRLALALGRVFGTGTNPRLADPQLEALRRMAVQTWHYGYTVPGHAVRSFVEAGFSPDQYELLVDSIRTVRGGGFRAVA